MKSLKRVIKDILKKIFLKYASIIQKHIDIINNYLEEERTKKIQGNFQSVGYNLEFEGGGSYITSPDHIIIGDNVHLGQKLYFKSEGGIIIGDNTFISDGVTINTIDQVVHEKKYQPVLIEENVRIGMNVTIEPGVEIRNGARIGAGVNVSRDIEQNEYLNINDKRVKNINVKKRNSSPSYLELPSSKLYFVLSTGRCGSKSFAKNLNKHQKAYASHEEIKQFIRLSTELAHGEKKLETIKEEVENIFKYKTLKGFDGYNAVIHSDQRLWNLVPILVELFPKSNFIHLIRDGRDTVRSMYARNWFLDNEYEINKQQWAEYRLNGYLAGEVERKTWDEWGSFERSCWYWSYINESIASVLKDKQTHLVKLEKIDQNISSLFSFLNLNSSDLEFGKYNSVRRKNQKKYNFEWDGKKEKIFQKVAGTTQSNFYNEV